MEIMYYYATPSPHLQKFMVAVRDEEKNNAIYTDTSYGVQYQRSGSGLRTTPPQILISREYIDPETLTNNQQPDHRTHCSPEECLPYNDTRSYSSQAAINKTHSRRGTPPNRTSFSCAMPRYHLEVEHCSQVEHNSNSGFQRTRNQLQSNVEYKRNLVNTSIPHIEYMITDDSEDNNVKEGPLNSSVEYIRETYKSPSLHSANTRFSSTPGQYSTNSDHGTALNPGVRGHDSNSYAVESNDELYQQTYTGNDGNIISNVKYEDRAPWQDFNEEVMEYKSGRESPYFSDVLHCSETPSNPLKNERSREQKKLFKFTNTFLVRDLSPPNTAPRSTSAEIANLGTPTITNTVNRRNGCATPPSLFTHHKDLPSSHYTDNSISSTGSRGEYYGVDGRTCYTSKQRHNAVDDLRERCSEDTRNDYLVNKYEGGGMETQFSRGLKLDTTEGNTLGNTPGNSIRLGDTIQDNNNMNPITIESDDYYTSIYESQSLNTNLSMHSNKADEQSTLYKKRKLHENRGLFE